MTPCPQNRHSKELGDPIITNSRPPTPDFGYRQLWPEPINPKIQVHIDRLREAYKSYEVATQALRDYVESCKATATPEDPVDKRWVEDGVEMAEIDLMKAQKAMDDNYWIDNWKSNEKRVLMTRHADFAREGFA